MVEERTGLGLTSPRAILYGFLLGLMFWALALFAIAIGSSFAYKLIGSKWDKSELGYTADARVAGYVSSGLAQWTGVTNLTVYPGGHDIDVVVAPLLPPIFYDTQPAQSNLAQAGGRISHCEVRLDPVNFFNLSAAAQAATVTHELGHCIGLDHSDEPSVMKNPNFWNFAADDAAGAIALYGPKQQSAPPTPAPTQAPPPPAPTAVPTQLAIQPPAASSAPSSQPPMVRPSTNPNPPAATQPREAVAPSGSVATWSLATWGGGKADPAGCNCQAIFGSDGSFWTSDPDVPSFLLTLTSLEEGQAYWFRQ